MTKTPPHHHKNTTTKTPPHHHKNATTKTPPQEHHHKNTTTKTPQKQHHHTTTKTPPQKHKNTTTPPQKHHHKNTTQPHHHKNITTQTPPQKHHHKNTTTPPQKHHPTTPREPERKQSQSPQTKKKKHAPKKKKKKTKTSPHPFLNVLQVLVSRIFVGEWSNVDWVFLRWLVQPPTSCHFSIGRNDESLGSFDRISPLMLFLVCLPLIKVGLKNRKLESNHFTNHIAREFASSAFCCFFLRCLVLQVAPFFSIAQTKKHLQILKDPPQKLTKKNTHDPIKDHISNGAPSPPPFGQEQTIQSHHQSCQRFTALGTLIICIICGCCIHRIQLLVHRTRQVLPELPATWCLWFSIVLAEQKTVERLGNIQGGT